jgi:hypothetical protein
MAEMETMFRDKFSENIRVSAIFSHQAHREECNSYSHKAFRDCDAYLGNHSVDIAFQKELGLLRAVMHHACDA